MSRTRRSFIRPTILATILALLYNNWLLAPFLNPHLSTARSLISEISAGTQPFHWVFQLADIAAGVAAIAMTPLIWQLVKVRGIAEHGALAATVAVIGVDSMLDALLPIACAPAADAQCQLLGTHEIITTAHLVESNLTGLLLFLAPLVWWWFARHKHARLARVSLLLASLELATGAAILITRLHGIHIEGFLQRGYELAIGAWLGYLAALGLCHWLSESFIIQE